MSAADPKKGAAATLSDELKFLRGLVARPRTTGAISPSGPALTCAMASHVDPNDTLPVIELGLHHEQQHQELTARNSAGSSANASPA